MALSEEKILTSIEYNLEASTINVLWKIRIFRDGVLFNESNHRGAYPVDEQGNVDDEVRTLLGKSLQEILGEASSNAQREHNQLRANLEQLQVVNESLTTEKDFLINSVQELTTRTNELIEENTQKASDVQALISELFQKTEQARVLNTELEARVGEVSELRAELEALKGGRETKPQE
jgi:ElaB/YqjD/DUF883 family membrane-anchored ribosome-binding protein